VTTVTGTTSWANVIANLEKKDNPVGDIVIMGHGDDGGVQASGSNADGDIITDVEAKLKLALTKVPESFSSAAHRRMKKTMIS
jgi:carbonic anhydrase